MSTFSARTGVAKNASVPRAITWTKALRMGFLLDPSPPAICVPLYGVASLEFGRRRERTRRIDHEHDQRDQLVRAAVEHLHRHIGRVAVHAAAALAAAPARRRALAQATLDHVERFRVRMRVPRLLRLGWPGAV